MANHIRQQLRERAGTVLTGLTTTGSNVSGYYSVALDMIRT